MRVLNKAFDHPLELEENAAMPLAGGIMQRGYQCGMLWGATLAAGAQAYRLLGPGPEAETKAIIAAQRLIKSFGTRNNAINCLELTDTEWQKTIQMISYLFKGGPVRCFNMALKYAPVALVEINTALSADKIATPTPPVSCAALLAERMGGSGMHRVMAAGLAGGIGLSGGACGALGAAIWMIEMNSLKEGNGKTDFKNPRIMDAIDRFMQCTNSKFECSEIIGRRFESIDDHAGYLHESGCSKIINILATQ